MERIIMHIDVNNAFLSWTAIDLLNHGFKIDIRNTYAVIGGDESKRRGIVLAKSMLAKQKGIVTAETLWSARKKCPNISIYPPNYQWYQKMSHALFQLLSKYSPDIEVVSIDECFLDYTAVHHLYGEPFQFAQKIQQEIYDTLHFTVNIGIARNKLCAKMASDFSKPNKIHTLFPNEIATKMWPLPVGDLFGIGRRTVPKLQSLNINIIEDLAHYDPHKLSKYFKNQASLMIKWANGHDDTPVISIEEESKGVSNTTTLEKNLCHFEEAEPILRDIAENLCAQLRREKRYAKVVAVIIKDKYFRSYSHQYKLTNATNNTKEVWDISKRLFQEVWDGEPIRLLGIRMDQLTTVVHHQVSLFEDVEEKEKDQELEQLVDELKLKYGSKVINKANLVDKKISKKYQI